MAHHFNLSEAEALLPEVGRLIRNAVSLKSEYESAGSAFESLVQKVMFQGGILVDREQAMADKTRRDRLAEQLKGVLESIQETGCLVKDLDIGLVDFPTYFKGEEVYLCWRMDEEAIGFWHGTTEGFAGRKAIDQYFLDHHQGDRRQ